MMKFIIIAGLGVVLFKMLVGRWPWEPKITAKQRALNHARKALGVSNSATRAQIVQAHRNILSEVHPDKGGSDTQAYEANAARDLLLAELPENLD